MALINQHIKRVLEEGVPIPPHLGILKEIAAGGQVRGDTTTLEDFSVVAALQAED